MNSNLRNKASPVSASDFGISLCSDLRAPLMITYQLFWFTDEITRFLELEFYFRSKSGIIMGALNDFTYERVKMEGTERVYLLGFGSNSNKECYKEITIYCSSEEEKLATHEQVMSSLHELVEKSYGMNGSSYMSWPI